MSPRWAHYASATALLKGIGLLLLPLSAAYLGSAGLGQLGLMVALANVGSIVIGLGLPECCQRFASDRVRYADSKKLGLWAAGLAIALSPLMAMGLSLWQASGIAFWAWLPLLINLGLGALLSLRLVELRIEDDSWNYLKLVATQAGLQVTLTFAALIGQFGVLGVAWAGLMATLLALLSCLPALRAQFRGLVAPLNWSLLGFGAPLALGMMTAFALGGYERGWLAESLSLSELGVYVLMFQLSLIPALALEPFMLWWGPKRYQLAEQRRYGYIGGVLASASLVLMAVVVAASLVLPPLVLTLFGASYLDGLPWLRLLLIATLLRQLSCMLNLGVYCQNHSGVALMINLLVAGPALVLIPVAIHHFGVGGALWTLLLLQGARLLLFYQVSQRMLPIPYDSRLGWGLGMVVLWGVSGAWHGAASTALLLLLLGLSVSCIKRTQSIERAERSPQSHGPAIVSKVEVR
ncbi:lipopolysaccharide biosynthesis protein [Ferrimonas aestuarii]|uniref:Membrane protein involved in the export of O-antigen and teichoic acid n=1 Tax=Ferrimonas aestuarii TaxID=2569539 RepID=A0A4U1BTL4_9GAMM|nr:hypothetical protein [Ferrimonas aestuarii]TKB57288.1 hypothetical protein FCL42_03135 [Ferrimonas aestuarii]